MCSHHCLAGGGQLQAPTCKPGNQWHVHCISTKFCTWTQLSRTVSEMALNFYNDTLHTGVHRAFLLWWHPVIDSHSVYSVFPKHQALLRPWKVWMTAAIMLSFTSSPQLRQGNSLANPELVAPPSLMPQHMRPHITTTCHTRTTNALKILSKQPQITKIYVPNPDKFYIPL